MLTAAGLGIKEAVFPHVFLKSLVGIFPYLARRPAPPEKKKRKVHLVGWIRARNIAPCLSCTKKSKSISNGKTVMTPPTSLRGRFPLSNRRLHCRQLLCAIKFNHCHCTAGTTRAPRAWQTAFTSTSSRMAGAIILILALTNM